MELYITITDVKILNISLHLRKLAYLTQLLHDGEVLSEHLHFRFTGGSSSSFCLIRPAFKYRPVKPDNPNHESPSHYDRTPGAVTCIVRVQSTALRVFISTLKVPCGTRVSKCRHHLAPRNSYWSLCNHSCRSKALNKHGEPRVQTHPPKTAVGEALASLASLLSSQRKALRRPRDSYVRLCTPVLPED